MVICRRCTSLTRPAGCNITNSMPSRPRHASIAAEPVSPDVAPTIVTVLACAFKFVFEESTNELKGDILERQSRAPEQFEQVLVVCNLIDRHNIIVTK